MDHLNDAARKNLERVLAEERRLSTLWLIRIRFGLAALALVVIWVVMPMRRELLPTGVGVLLFVAINGALLIALPRWRALSRWGALSVPLVDVPLLAAIQHVQLEALPAAWMGIPTNLSLMSAFLVLSALSLSRTVVWVTAATALAAMLSILLRQPGLEAGPILLSALAPLGMALVLTTLIGRLAALLHEARKRDLLGKYVLGERLGVGGMAEVFLATYSPEGGFERRVAVKRILPSIAVDPEAVALFRREAELGALLAHPNIVQVLDFGADADSYFLAMEYVEGISLARLLQREKDAGARLPLPAVVAIATHVAEALDYIHGRTTPTGAALGLVHRDLNPPNVLVSRIGEVKLGDFGIARSAASEQLTAAGVFRGKVGYSAPEQLLGGEYDGRADLFSLGATLHEALTGDRLFAGNSNVAAAIGRIHAPLRAPSEARAEVPAALDRIVLALLAPDPAGRTQTAAEVVHQLAALPSSLTDPKVGRRQLAELAVAALRSEAATVARAQLETRRSDPAMAGAAEALTQRNG